LSASTRDRLRILAAGALEGLGVRDPTPPFIQDEMLRQCAQLAASLTPAATAEERESLLRIAIERAIERLDDDPR
jgi:hypothetical protein